MKPVANILCARGPWSSCCRIIIVTSAPICSRKYSHKYSTHNTCESPQHSAKIATHHIPFSMSKQLEHDSQDSLSYTAQDYIATRDSVAKQGMLRALDEAGLPDDQVRFLVASG